MSYTLRVQVPNHCLLRIWALGFRELRHRFGEFMETRYTLNLEILVKPCILVSSENAMIILNCHGFKISWCSFFFFWGAPRIPNPCRVQKPLPHGSYFAFQAIRKPRRLDSNIISLQALSNYHGRFSKTNRIKQPPCITLWRTHFGPKP